jgi:LacI family transcriptional regulator
MTDVASACSVSIATVSRVLNNNPAVDGELRMRVQAAIKSLNYRPNLLAQSMRKQETRVVGCIVANVANPMTATMVSAAEEALRAANYAMVLANSGDRIANELDLLDFFQGRQVDGLLISMSSEVDPDILKHLRGAGKPIVLLERQIADEFDSVLSDQGGGAYLAAKHLLELGHRDIAMITGQILGRPARERIKHFERAYADYGLKPNPAYIHPGDNQTIEFGFNEANQLLRSDKPPTAIIAGAYEMTGVIKAVRAMGLEAPTDVSLIAMGDPEFLQFVNPSKTAVRWDERNVGRTGASILLDRMQRDERHMTRRLNVVSSDLVVRDSCLPLKSTRR